MKEFLLVYRSDENAMKALVTRTPGEMQASNKRWMDWIGGIAAQNKLSARGNKLIPSGKVIKNDTIIADGPYMEIKECLIGYSIVKSNSLEEATELAMGCPVFYIGGTVEVREIGVFQD